MPLIKFVLPDVGELKMCTRIENNLPALFDGVGASKCIITDLRKEFVSEYVFEAIKCNAIYEGQYLLGTSIARPCISKEMIRIATEEGAQYIGHSATGKGNDQVRFEMCAQALSPTIQCVSPWRVAKFIESFKGCSDLLAYCNTHGIPVDAKPKSNYHSEGTQ